MRPPDVNRTLTRKRRGPAVENDQYAAFLRRALRAYARRIAVGDIDSFTEMAAIAAEMDQILRQAVAGLRAKVILSFRVSQCCDLRRPVVDGVSDGTLAA